MNAQRQRSQARRIKLRDGDEVFVRVIHEPTAHGVPILLNDGLGCDGYIWRHLIDWLKRDHPIVHWNYRGHGESPPPTHIPSYSLTALLSDLDEVLDVAGYQQAVIVGHSMGVQVALETWALRPERVLGLVLLFGSYEHPIESWHAAFDRGGSAPVMNRLMRRYFDQLSSAIVARGHLFHPLWKRVLQLPLSYQVATRLEVNGQRLSWVDFGPYLTELGKMDPRVFFHLARELAEHSAARYLPKIDVPTLIFGGTRDTFTPGWRSEEMARRIKNSELVVVEGATHTGPLEDTALIGERVSRFLSRLAA